MEKKVNRRGDITTLPGRGLRRGGHVVRDAGNTWTAEGTERQTRGVVGAVRVRVNRRGDITTLTRA